MTVSIENTPHEDFVAHRKAQAQRRACVNAGSAPDLYAIEVLPDDELALKIFAAATTVQMAIKGIAALHEEGCLCEGNIGRVHDFARELEAMAREVSYRLIYTDAELAKY